MIREITEKDYPQLMSIWESAVLNTHDFLKKEDFNYYKEQIPGYFEHVTLVGFEEANVLAGFMGVAEGNLEMLFIHNDYRGKGIGKKLIRYGMDRLEITKVDVNEQNIQAVGFYKHIGFHVLGRSESDGQGKEYPILHMGLES
ncbi:GNAT family N-acetyltransferase [Chryseobacterium bernardetii]